MEPKKRKLIGAQLSPEWTKKVEKICEVNKETTTNLIKRLITKELALIEGKEDKATYTNQGTIERKIDLLLSKQNEILSKSDDVDKKATRIISSICYLIRTIFNQFYYITQVLSKQIQLTTEDKKSIQNNSEDRSAKSFQKYLDRIQDGTPEIIMEYCKTAHRVE